jgi:hypothetical protein
VPICIREPRWTNGHPVTVHRVLLRDDQTPRRAAPGPFSAGALRCAILSELLPGKPLPNCQGFPTRIVKLSLQTSGVIHGKIMHTWGPGGRATRRCPLLARAGGERQRGRCFREGMADIPSLTSLKGGTILFTSDRQRSAPRLAGFEGGEWLARAPWRSTFKSLQRSPTVIVLT